MLTTKANQTALPPEVRQALDLKEDDSLLWEFADGEVHLTTRRHKMRKAQQLVRQYVPEGISLVDELVAERRAEANHH